MDWWVHGIGADRALQQLVDAARRGTSDRRSSPAGCAASTGGGLAGERVLVVGIVIIDPVGRRHALDIIQIQLHYFFL